eukprot:3175210-Rhodomonas_salina.2
MEDSYQRHFQPGALADREPPSDTPGPSPVAAAQDDADADHPAAAKHTAKPAAMPIARKLPQAAVPHVVTLAGASKPAVPVTRTAPGPAAVQANLKTLRAQHAHSKPAMRVAKHGSLALLSPKDGKFHMPMFPGPEGDAVRAEAGHGVCACMWVAG